MLLTLSDNQIRKSTYDPSFRGYRQYRPTETDLEVSILDMDFKAKLVKSTASAFKEYAEEETVNKLKYDIDRISTPKLRRAILGKFGTSLIHKELPINAVWKLGDTRLSKPPLIPLFYKNGTPDFKLTARAVLGGYSEIVSFMATVSNRIQLPIPCIPVGIIIYAQSDHGDTNSLVFKGGGVTVNAVSKISMSSCKLSSAPTGGIGSGIVSNSLYGNFNLDVEPAKYWHIGIDWDIDKTLEEFNDTIYPKGNMLQQLHAGRLMSSDDDGLSVSWPIMLARTRQDFRSISDTIHGGRDIVENAVNIAASTQSITGIFTHYPFNPLTYARYKLRMSILFKPA